MKAEKVIGIAACAFACVTSSAFANSTTNWFGVTASPDVVATDVTIKTNNVTVAIADIVADSKITLDGDTELTFAPTDGNPARSDNLVTIESTAVLTPNAFADLPPSSELTGAQVGFAVAYNGDVTNYYYYAYANDAGAWTAGAGTPPANAEVTFKITLDYRSHKAKFEVGNTVVAEDVAFSGTKLNTVAALGSGSLTGVSADYEIAVAQYGDKKYGSIAEAVDAAKDAGVSPSEVQAVDANGTAQSKDTKASNGLNLVVCEAMGLPTDKTTDEATIKLESATKSHADKITLAWKKPESADDGVTIKFQVMNGGAPEGEPCDWDDIQIPMNTGTYTIVPSIK